MCNTVSAIDKKVKTWFKSACLLFAGRRHCLGKEMALKELFIFITSLVQRFRFSPPDGATKLPEDGICGFTRGPVPYKICAKPRV